MATRAPFLIFVLVAAAHSPAAEHVWTGVERIVAVGDVHGDYAQFVTVLRAAGIVNGNDDWAGGRTHLVQTGDIPDRGPDTRKLLDLLQKLEKQATKAGGMVHALIGNHEAMNVYGDLRYVIPEEYASFQSPRSEEYRETYYEQHVEAMKAEAPPEQRPTFDDAYRQQWFAEHPPGFFEHRIAFAPDGELGRWIGRHSAVIQINDMLFLHGGLSRKYAKIPLDNLNKAIQDTLQGKGELDGSPATDDEGPLWYRGLAQHPEGTEAPNVDAVLSAHGAKRIVIGHTPTAGTVLPRFGGKVIMIDVGLSAYYGARQACLLVENGEVFTLHRGQRLKTPMNGDEDLLRYLEAAAALDPAPSPLLAEIEQLKARLPVPK